jgi:hypothetical protein
VYPSSSGKLISRNHLLGLEQELEAIYEKQLTELREALQQQEQVHFCFFFYEQCF